MEPIADVFVQDLFDRLLSGHEASKEADKLKGREPFLQKAIVANNKDPLGYRRLEVTRAASGGKLQTDWVTNINPNPFYDGQLPQPGQTVVVGFFNGDPHDGFWLGVLHNDRNSPINKANPDRDDAEVIDGNVHREVGGNWSVKVASDSTIGLTNSKGAVTIDPQGNIAFANQVGSLTIQANGKASLTSKGAQITINSNGSITIESPVGITLKGPSVNAVTPSLTQNGVPVKLV